MKCFFVYILTNHSRTLYTGVTGNMSARLNQHREKAEDGFTQKYNMGKLVYYETYPDPISAISREKQIKGWVRRKKIALIESMNPGWTDLASHVARG